MSGKWLHVGLAVALPILGACSKDSTQAVSTTTLASVSPAGGVTGVNVGANVTVRFSHAIMAGMDQYAALLEGDVTGPVVPGVWTILADRTTLTFTPAQPLKAATHYTVHLGGGMKDSDGKPIAMDPGQMMGGQWVSGSMMTGGGTMGGNGSMMGPGWQSANGMYGMVFSFTTA